FHRKKKQKGSAGIESDDDDGGFSSINYSPQLDRDPSVYPTRFALRCHTTRCRNREDIKATSKRGEMATKVCGFSDLIQRVTASCLLHPLATTGGKHDPSGNNGSGTEEDYVSEYETTEDEEEEEEEEGNETEEETENGEIRDWKQGSRKKKLQSEDAHCPWDPERMRSSDVAVVGELRKLGVLRERFRRSVSVGGGGGGRRRRGGNAGGGSVVGMLREAVAPYEAAVEELKKEVKAREAEVVNLKEKLKSAAVTCHSNGGGKKGRSQSKRKVSCSHATQGDDEPGERISKGFTAILLSLMRAAHWDIPAAVRSIEAAAANATAETVTTINAIASTAATHHAKYALESDMKAMDPVELLGILPTCHFGKFCSKKYLAIVHPKMEESLFGNLEQRQQVAAGNHPRSQFYGEFLGLAKAIWLLHLLAFSLDPAPNQFEASRGAEFHAQYMESVVRFSGGRVPAGQVVGFPVCPGFKLGNGSIVKARVYLVPRT
ncbi:unnamed protein product, partial [Linum tenue]